MTPTLRILMIVHGFPPRETAGTEQHVHQLTEALRNRGHAVHVLAATRSPGDPQYARLEEEGVTRVVNNVPTRRLADGEGDALIDQIAQEVCVRFQPDVVHVHHIQFLSSSMRFSVPMVLTLHDRWGWCAAGGLGLLPDGAPCAGPAPQICAPCAGAWRPTPGSLSRGMLQAAEWLSPLVSPDTLHGLYRRIPARLRPRPERGAGPTETPDDAAHRNAQVGAFYRSAAKRISPSAHLAKEAMRQGLGPVEVIPHGVPAAFFTESSAPRQAFVHLGTIAHHKGTDRVVAAWREAVPDEGTALRIHGPVLDSAAAVGHPIGPVLDRSAVQALLSEARALVLAPRWQENSPLIALEARAAGCPVIAPRSGGFPELVEDGIDGILFDPDDPGALVRAMHSALKGPMPTPRPPPRLSAQIDATEALYRSMVTDEAGECA